MRIFLPRFASARPLPARKLGLVLGALLGTLGVLYVTAAALIDTAKLQSLAQAQVNALTGRELMVKGSASAALLPRPHLTLSNIELSSADGAPMLRAAGLRLDIAWSSIFSASPQIRKIALDSPLLELQKKPSGHAEWDWLAPLGTGLQAAGAGSFAIDIHGGTITYLDAGTENSGRLENISLSFLPSYGGSGAVSGSLSYRGQTLMLAGQTGAPRDDGGADIALRLWQSDTTYLEFKGETVMQDQRAHVRGALKLNIENLNAWSAPPVEAPPAPPPNYGLALAATLDWAGHALTLSDLSLETPDSAATGKASITFAAVPQLAAELEFSRLKLDPALALLRTPATPAGAASSYIDASATALPNHMEVSVALTARDVLLGSYHLAAATLTASLKEGALTISRMSALLPGETQVTLAGSVTDTTRGPRFQGVAETSGKDLRLLLSTFEPSAQQLPAKGMGEFSVRGNFFFSSEQLRLSEAEAKLEDLSLNGGLVTYFEATPRIEAEIALSGTNLDYFRDSWRTETQQGGDFIFKINSGVDFSWLRELKPIVDLKINLTQFTFLDRQGSAASFRLYAKQNEFGVYNLDATYPEGSLKGKVKVNVAGEVPLIQVEAEAPWFDTAYFARNPAQTPPPLVNPGSAENRWSKDLFDFSWMIGVSSKVNLTIGALTHRGQRYDKFQLEGTLGDEQLQFRKCAFERFGGRIEATGTLVGGKVPGLTTSFTAYNVDLAEIIRLFSTVDKLTGRASFSGTVVTSGIHFASWVEQADAKIVMAARGVRVQGFNVQGVVDSVNAARSVAEVVSNVGRSLPSGTTDFSVDGNINVNGGIMRTPGMSLKAGRIAASLGGELQLITWKMALGMLFQFPMLQSETVPTLAVDVVGTPEDYLFKFDTSSLEAYVAKRIVGK